MIGEFIYMLPSDMNLRIGKVKNYNNKYEGRSIIIKRTKQMGVNRLNSVQKATNLKKKSKVGINEMFSNC